MINLNTSSGKKGQSKRIFLRGNTLVFILLVVFSCQNPRPNSQEAATSNESDSLSKVQMLLYISDKDEGFNIYQNSLESNAEEAFTQDPGWEWYPQFVSSRAIIIHNTQDTLDNFSQQAKDLEGNPIPFETREVRQISAGAGYYGEPEWVLLAK